MEEVNCLLCGHAERRIRFQSHDRYYPLPGTFTLVECTCCGFLYLSPRPDSSEIARYYPAEYLFYHQKPGEQDGRFIDDLSQYDLKKRCEIVLRYCSTGNLLDWGCGSGHFLGAMQRVPGWSVRGLEPFAPNAAEYAREMHGVTVDEVAPDEIPYPEGSFDVVTLWEVLEHLPRPVDTLRRIHALLRPGGVLVLSVPNRSSFLARTFGSAWIGLDVPRHFSVFAPLHIEQALFAAGFSKPDIFSERGRLGAAHTELLCAMASVFAALDGNRATSRSRRLASSIFGPVVSNPVTIVSLFLLTLPYSILARKLNRGSQMVVVARREKECK